HTLYGMDIWCLRFFTCYGPAQRPDLAIHRFTRLIDEGKPITVYGDGSTTRDYLYIDDCVAGVMAAMERCKGFEIINLGEEQTVRLDRLVEMLSQALGKTAKIDRQPVHPGDMLHTRADVTKARKLLGYQPHTMIEEGLKRFIGWYRKKDQS
ncbi:MAG: GDP-mannose 4,6-dehydratase, partial [Planctomycetes bacterium]|nr:GDP-mannose 4,6-dehydratase [Planctomycetota bacterium]